ncbi:hypothetical protein INN71_03070 [Nocardioides sp. ChNu-153]|uniref:hypothetical protein n=1 Tax=Nocardioides sp. ChNu-153 TaxID=2779364 RepID=UPI00265196E4|nr:hypothetical protein [Nocardioides sp. ChNu-153]MDN7120367.1 hypothetical protein [Nocardioides sp. ChNu-153]
MHVPRASLGAAMVGGFSAAAAGVLLGSDAGDDDPVATAIACLLLLVTAGAFVVSFRAGVGARRQTREVLRERGYRRGEQPWPWAAHGTWVVVTPVAAVTFLAMQRDGGSEAEWWAAWLIVVGAGITAAQVVWSAVQKGIGERARRRQGRRVDLSRPVGAWQLLMGVLIGLLLLLNGVSGLVSTDDGMLTAWWDVVATAVGAPLLVGIAVTALRRLLAQH